MSLLKYLRVVVGAILIVTGVANVLIWSDAIGAGRLPLGLSAIGIAAAMYVAGVCILYQGLPGDRPRRELRAARRVALVSLILATLITGIASPGIALHLQGASVFNIPWMVLFLFYAGMILLAILLAWLVLWKAPSLIVWTLPPPDPYDPPDPAEEMIVPDPGPTVGALLARKRALNLARAR